MSFVHVSEDCYETLRYIGVAIRQFEATGQKHIGVVYRHDTLGARFCHFLGHCTLHITDDPPIRNYLWDRCHSIDDDDVTGRVMAALIASIKGGDRVPYGFVNDTQPFANNGTFVEMEIGKGLTCASFVLTIFHQSGIDLLDTQAWQIRADDIEWQTRVVHDLRRDGYTDHADAAEQYIGAFRFRPEEVAAAAAHESPPIGFEDAVKLANAILADLAAMPRHVATDVVER
jgi:hypothetical protein